MSGNTSWRIDRLLPPARQNRWPPTIVTMDDGDNRVRPLAIGEEDTASHRRGWLPILIVLVLGAVGAALIAQGSTGTAEIAPAGDAAEALFTPGEPTTTSTTREPTPPPPRIRDLLPDFSGRLVFVGRDGSFSYHGEWLDGWSSPRVLPAPAPINEAQFDVRANEVAAISYKTLSDGVLFTSRDPTIDLRPSFSPVNSLAWHDTQPGQLAWTGAAPGVELPALFVGQHSLRVGQNLVVAETVTSLPPASDVVAWGDWGFLVRNDSLLWSLDRSGEMVGVVSGRLVANDGNGRFLIRPITAQESLVESFTSYFDLFATPLSITPETLVDAPEGTYVADSTLAQIPNTRVLPHDDHLTFLPNSPMIVAWDRPGDAQPALIDTSSLQQTRLDIPSSGTVLDLTSRYILYQLQRDEVVLMDLLNATSATLPVDGLILVARILER